MGDKSIATPASSGPSPDLSSASTQRRDQAQFNDDDSRDASPEGDDPESDGNDKPQMPMQKRRRVTRACDECRRKKIKCDGKQPCTHCTVYSYGESTWTGLRGCRINIA